MDWTNQRQSIKDARPLDMQWKSDDLREGVAKVSPEDTYDNVLMVELQSLSVHVTTCARPLALRALALVR
jgi:hypothetical protein